MIRHNFPSPGRPTAGTRFLSRTNLPYNLDMKYSILTGSSFAALLFCILILPASAAPATQPAATQPSPKVLHWLDRIQQRAKQLKTLHAKVRYDRVQGLLGDTQRRFGTLVYQAGPPARFSVHFNKLIVGRALRPQNRYYIFDGHWLAEKLDDQKIFTRRQLVPQGQSKNLLDLNAGPFVLPLDADKSRILRRFNVTLIPPAPHQPKRLANSIHLRLIPKHNARIDQTRIDLWYDKNTLLPLKASTHDHSQNESIIDLFQAKLDQPVAPGTFNTTPPQGGGWDIRIKPLQPK